MGRGAWWATGVAKSRAQLSDWRAALILCWKSVLCTAGGVACTRWMPGTAFHSLQLWQPKISSDMASRLLVGGEGMTLPLVENHGPTSLKSKTMTSALALGLHRQL